MTDAQLDLRDPRWNESQTALDDHAGEHPKKPDDDWEEPEPEYEKTVLDEARCPECGNEDGITKTERANKRAQPIPPSMAGQCPECDHVDNPIAFHNAWQRERMTEEELAESRAEREAAMDRLADYQHSAHGIAEAREP